MVIFVALASRSLICSNMPFNWSSVTCNVQQQGQQSWQQPWRACQAVANRHCCSRHPAAADSYRSAADLLFL